MVQFIDLNTSIVSYGCRDCGGKTESKSVENSSSAHIQPERSNSDRALFV
ncbi:hypothetical protein [Chamaesiphon sp.]